MSAAQVNRYGILNYGKEFGFILSTWMTLEPFIFHAFLFIQHDTKRLKYYVTVSVLFLFPVT